MTSAQQIRDAVRRRQRRTRLLFGTVGLLVVVLAVSVVMSGGGTSGPAPSSSAPASRQGGGVSAQGEVTLPGAAELADGKFPVRFPHTPHGAVAAMVAMLNNSWTMDVQHNLKAADIYAQPASREKARLAAEPSAQRLREGIGLPLTGGVPDGAYSTVTPRGVKWQALGPDRVRVAVMVRFTAAASSQTTPVVRDFAMSSDWLWDPAVRSGDWVLSLDQVDEFTPDLAEPGTARFKELGWLAVQR